MMAFYLTALGCKLNQAEVESLARRIVARGYAVVRDPRQATWAIVNTCTVTHVAARKSRQVLRQLRQANPGLRLAVIGCYGTMAAEEARTIAGVELVVPNAEKDQVLERILALTPGPPALDAGALPPLALGHTRAFIKIQDGCENRCAYCIVTLARGPLRSRPVEEVLEEIGQRLAEGYQEVVLTGVNIGAYGRDGGATSLAGLVRAILQRQAPRRLRLSSIEPWDLTEELLALWPHPCLCRHLHLPLQSGCDATLRRMGRRYTCAEFAALVARARERIPELALTTDVIVGFPGETEQEFRQTVAFIAQQRFSRLHVFKYSRRPGTPAAEMPHQVPPQVAEERSDRLLALGRELAAAFHAQCIGREVEVLLETAQRRGEGLMWSGLTDNYVRVTVRSEGHWANTLARVHCLRADETGVEGVLLPRES